MEKNIRYFLKQESTFQSLFRRTASFIQAMRLHLYSMAFVSVLLGTALGASVNRSFSWGGFLLAALISLCGHAAVSLSNEAVDEAGDKVNENRTIFNGGTGLLLKGKITKRALNAGWITFSLLALALPVILVILFHYSWFLIACSILCLILGLGYSFPPFRFSRWGAGELAALLAYGFPLLLGAFLLQDPGAAALRLLGNYRFYLLVLPFSFSVFVLLSLTQIPDTEADRKMGRRSISVLLGPKNVLIFCAVLLLICTGLFISFVPFGILSLTYTLISIILPALTTLLILFNLNVYTAPAGLKMVNIMGMAISTCLASAVIPSIYYFTHTAVWL
jgi:1,4-dihydroxy-2-naphthoate octaprenyltransferase